MDRLLNMEVFVAVVEAGSLRAAADLHRMSPPMAGKHIRALEERLGVQLLVRSTRRQRLTEAGQQFYTQCKAILAQVREAEAGAEALRAAPRGHVRVSAPVTYGSLALAPAIADYLRTQPEVSVDLVLDDALVDLVRDGFDVAVRIGPLADSGLVARRLGRYRSVICAAPTYLARCGTPRSPAELTQHQCLGFSGWTRTGGWRLDGDGGTPRTRFTANHGQALRTAAVAGFGLVLQPELLLADDIASGRLVEVLQPWWPTPRPVHLLYPRDRQAPPKLTSFVQCMLARLAG